MSNEEVRWMVALSSVEALHETVEKICSAGNNPELYALDACVSITVGIIEGLANDSRKEANGN